MPEEVDNVYTSSESDGNSDVKDLPGRSAAQAGPTSLTVRTKGSLSTPPATTSPAAVPSLPSSSAKDPLRPKRKKARRACQACQRAHLTCGAFTLSPFGLLGSK
jgi:hypothetical protein